MICPFCHKEVAAGSRFCTRCGNPLPEAPGEERPASLAEEMNMTVLYGMVGLLFVALIVPPWEAPPTEPPAFLGFHFILSPPQSQSEADGVISRLLLTIELTTIGVGGMYFSWLFRKKT